MNDKLKKAAQNITMPNELKERISAECKAIPHDEGMEAEHVFTVERVQKRPIGRIITAIAASAVLAGGIGMAGMKIARDGQNASSEITSEYYEISPFGDLRTKHLTNIMVMVSNGNGGYNLLHVDIITDEQHQRLGDLFNSHEWVEKESYAITAQNDELRDKAATVCYMEFEEQPDPNVTRGISIYENDLLCYTDPNTQCNIFYDIDTAAFTKAIYDIIGEEPSVTDEGSTTLKEENLELSYIALDTADGDAEKNVRELLNNMPIEEVANADFYEDPSTPLYWFSESVERNSGCAEVLLYDTGYMEYRANGIAQRHFIFDFKDADEKLRKLLMDTAADAPVIKLGMTDDAIDYIVFEGDGGDIAVQICGLLNDAELRRCSRELAYRMVMGDKERYVFNGSKNDGEKVNILISDTGYMLYSVLPDGAAEPTAYIINSDLTSQIDSIIDGAYSDDSTVYTNIRFDRYRGLAERELDTATGNRVFGIISSNALSFAEKSMDSVIPLSDNMMLITGSGSDGAEFVFELYIDNDAFRLCTKENGETVSDRIYYADGEKLRNELLNVIDPQWMNAPFHTLFKMTEKLYISADTSRFAVDTSKFDLMIPDGTFDFKAVLGDEQAIDFSYAFWGWNWDEAAELDEFPAIASPVLAIDTNTKYSDLSNFIYVYDDGTVITKGGKTTDGRAHDIMMYENVDLGTGELVRTLLKAIS